MRIHHLTSTSIVSQLVRASLFAALGILVAGSSAAAFDGADERCDAWRAWRMAHGVEAHSHGCVQKTADQLDILIFPRASISDPGADFEADVVVWFGSDADAVRMRITGSDALAGASDEFERIGRWSAGDTLDFPIRVPRVPGRGDLQVHATVLGDDDEALHAAAAEVFVRNDGLETWWSPLGHADLDLGRAAELESRGRLDAAGALAAREDAVGALMDVGTTPLPTRPRSQIEKQLDRAFADESAGATSSTSGVSGPAAAVTITVKGRVQFADSAGVLQAAAYTTVQIRDDDLIGSELVYTTFTDSLGRYDVTFTHNDGIGAGDPDIFVRAIARSSTAAVSPNKNPDDAYFVQSPTRDETPGGTTITANFELDSRSNDAHTAFGVHTALIWIGWYAGELAGTRPSQLRVRFPGTGSNMTSDGDGPFMNLLRLDRFDWDVITHEYGHYLSRIHGLTNSPGGPHNFGDNLWNRRGNKSEGLRLAWGEGWPTYFGTAGQRAAGLQHLGIPNVGDFNYSDLEDSAINYSLESGSTGSGPGNGEDNELSVQTFMWDMFDTAKDGLDESSFSDGFLFDTLKAAGVVTIGQAWEALAATQDNAGKAVMGGALSQANVAPEITDPPDQYEPDGSGPPIFKWKKNGAGTPNPLNDFKIVFFTSDFSSVVFEKELGDVAQYTPSAGDWSTILSSGGIVKWVVQGKNTAAPATPGGSLGRYWSAARTIGSASIAFVIDDTGSMNEEIGAVVSALQSYIDLVESTLEDGDTPPTIQLITFKDDVTTRATSNDLEVIRSAVGSLFASGGNDCPEYSAQALLLASKSVTSGGTILFATDASSQPGVDAAALIADLRARSITVNTILSGDCESLGSAKPLANTANLLAPSGDQEETTAQEISEKPGEDETPDDPIVDAGQPVLDIHGDTQATATPLFLDAPPVLGSVESGFGDPDADGRDWFVVPLEADTSYAISHEYVAGGLASVTVYNESGAILFGNVGEFSPSLTRVTPAETGNHYIQVLGFSDVSYRMSVATDPFGDLGSSAMALFSTISAETGGAFLVRDGVNFGNTEAYTAAVFNVMATTLGPGVLQANPSELPANTELAVTLTGGNTNWRKGSEVSFSGSGITVKSVKALSATSLEVLVEIAEGADTSFRDVTVTTPLGGGTEKAKGKDVVEVVPEPLFPTTLSVEPFVLVQDSSQTILIRGVKTNWKEGTTVEFLDRFGADDTSVSVEDVNVLSKTQIEADVSVSPGATLGFRSVSVLSGFDFTIKNRAVLVQASDVAIPEVDAVNPRSGLPGETLEVSVEASNTSFQDGVTTASFGAGIDVLSVAVDSSTSATVEIAIDAEAAVGFRDVVLTTGGESAALIDGFFVGKLLDIDVLPDNGKFSACLNPGAEAFFTFDVPVDRAIKSVQLEGIKMKKEAVGKLKQAELALIDPLENETRLGKLKKSKKKLKDSNIRLTLAGSHALAVRDTGGKGGCFKGKAKIEPTQGSIPFSGCLDPGEEFELFFSAEADSNITKLTVEGEKKKSKGKLDPEVTLEAPSGAMQEYEPESGKKVVVKDRALDEEGDWSIHVEGREGSGGCFSGKLKLDQGAGS